MVSSAKMYGITYDLYTAMHSLNISYCSKGLGQQELSFLNKIKYKKNCWLDKNNKWLLNIK